MRRLLLEYARIVLRLEHISLVVDLLRVLGVLGVLLRLAVGLQSRTLSTLDVLAEGRCGIAGLSCLLRMLLRLCLHTGIEVLALE